MMLISAPKQTSSVVAKGHTSLSSCQCHSFYLVSDSMTDFVAKFQLIQYNVMTCELLVLYYDLPRRLVTCVSSPKPENHSWRTAECGQMVVTLKKVLPSHKRGKWTSIQVMISLSHRKQFFRVPTQGHGMRLCSKGGCFAW